MIQAGTNEKTSSTSASNTPTAKSPSSPASAPSPQKICLDLAAHAATAGAAALMVVPPFYDPVILDQLRDLLSEIHTTSDSLPIVYYHIPAASGLHLSPAEIAGLSDVGVRYLKDTSGNAPAFTELLFGLHDRITAFNGWDTLTFYGLAPGAKCSVWGAGNLIPKLAVQL
ncbi:MAG: hypothetical protein Q9182_004249 [Xanthomendoza sp. 2 TL-2023]